MADISNLDLRNALTSANVRFFHAMDMRGTVIYIENGGVLSRAFLRQADPDYTEFWSDPEDEKREVLTRVFGNLYDFGAIFARARQAVTPNIYGPVTFKFRPQVFEAMNDLIITKESIVKLPDPWYSYSISDDTKVSRMLAGDSYGDPIAPEYQYSECSCLQEIVSFDYLESIIVDPITVNGVSLVDMTREIVKQNSLQLAVESRRYRRPENLIKIQSVIDSFENYHPQPERQPKGVPLIDIPDWVSTAQPWVKTRLEMWLNYFYNGTICYVRELQRTGR